MLQNVRVTAFTVSELLRENQPSRAGKITPSSPPPRVSNIEKFAYFKTYLDKSVLQAIEGFPLTNEI